MKKVIMIPLTVLAVAAMVISCEKEAPSPYVPQAVENAFEDVIPTGYYSYAQMSVPVGTDVVYIDYTYQDGSTKTVEQAVTPEMYVPTDGRDVEPFGTVKILLESEKPSKVSVYYKMNTATKADEDEDIYTLNDFPVDQITGGTFGETRVVQVTWNFAWTNSAATNWQNTRTYPKDVVMYDAEHNHTLRYTYAYSGVSGEGYMLTDAYEIEDHVATKYKYNYCSGCGNCPYCMPWGCSCGCESTNPDFVPSGDLTAQASADDAVVNGEGQNCDEGGEISMNSEGDVVVNLVPEDVSTVFLPEPKSYITTDGDYTMYHSSGVVMFDDSWPNLPQERDYNDIVVDYDIEAVTVADDRLAEEGWREELRVVMHIRAVGGTKGWRAGLILENLDLNYIEDIEDHYTLDSWQNPHGELPAWAAHQYFWENSVHYDNPRPAVEVGALQAFTGRKFNNAAGIDTYYYTNNGESTEHVMNPALKLYEAWGGAHEDQYDDVLAASTNPTLAQMQKEYFYNTVPGYVNVAGGLYTYTVIYKLKPRAEMTPEQSQLALANLIDAVVNTSSQNFYMVNQDFTSVGLKGYQPLDYNVRGFGKTYKAIYDEVMSSGKYPHLSTSTSYVSTDGMVWAFKCPTLTRHAWEKMPFEKAYPQYEEWVTSQGETNKEWYKLENANASYVSCEW